MEFQVVLNKMIEEHHARSSDICVATGLNRAYVSKIRNGGFVPSDYQTILDIADALNLTEEERFQLSESYQSAKAPDVLSNAWSTFNSFYTLTPPSMPACPDKQKADLTNGQLFTGKENVFGSIRQIALRATHNVMIFITPFNDTLKQLCEVACLSVKKDLQIQWLTVTDDSTNGRQNNLSAFTNVLSSLLVCNAHVGKIKSDLCCLIQNTAFPFYIIADNEMILLSEEVENALYFNANETISLYTEMFSRTVDRCLPFVHGYSNVNLFFDNINSMVIPDANDDLYIIKKYPCILFETNTHYIYDYVADTENSKELAGAYIKFLGGFTSIKSVCNVFLESTLDTYLHDECFYECSKHFSKSIPIELRRTMLQKLTDSSDNDRALPYMLRLPGFQNSSLYLVNVFSSGQIILFYSFENSYHIFTAFDKDIADSIISYLHSMMKCGILRSKDNSVEIIRQKLTEK